MSTSDRTGLVEFAQVLTTEFGVEVLSTGGTGGALRESGVPITEVAEITRFPEILDGRVKTLHPRIHAGLLARREDNAHMATLRKHEIDTIDLVCVNLYPFEQAISRPDCSLQEAVENIDIGGPSMLRSAAKNFRSIYVLSNPAQYSEVLERLRTDSGCIDPEFGMRLAVEVYRVTSLYDATITSYLASCASIPS
ncbi:MAG: hypothetical protein VX733_10830 [Candidatus Latescibacterota bacterium]|nr:hypothetical protein [Candidatus Latescibacterota bacterium]